MLRPFAVLPLQLACQILFTQNCVDFDVSRATDTSVAKRVTELPDGYAVFRDAGAAYKSYKLYKSWDEARKICAADGGHLAVIDSFKKVRFVMGVKEAGSYTWVGFHRLYDVNEWTDVKTGLPVVALPWRRDTWTYDQNRRCLALWADGSGLYSIGCYEEHPFICEISILKN